MCVYICVSERERKSSGGGGGGGGGGRGGGGRGGRRRKKRRRRLRLLIFIWYVTSTRCCSSPVYSRARGLRSPETIRCSSLFHPCPPPRPEPPLRPRHPPSLFRTTSAAVMPAANAREKLTQASPYGRARCIDRLLRCTSSTLAREPHPTSSSSSTLNVSPSLALLFLLLHPPLFLPAARSPLCLHLAPAAGLYPWAARVYAI